MELSITTVAVEPAAPTNKKRKQKIVSLVAKDSPNKSGSYHENVTLPVAAEPLPKLAELRFETP